MFAYAETDPQLDARRYERQAHNLRSELLLQQYDLLNRADRTVLLVIAGIDGAGKGSTINLLNEWLDPRHIRTLAFGPPSPEERQRPPLWRYWQALPAKGHIGMVFGSWYAQLLAAAARGRLPTTDLDRQAEALQRFETMLLAEGVQVIKLWYHLSREAQQARCEALSADPDTAWRVSDADRRVVANFHRIRRSAERVLQATQSPDAPWHIIPSADDHYRIVATAERLRDALNDKLPAPAAVPVPLKPQKKDLLATLDYTARLPKPTYDSELPHWQGRLNRAVRDPRFRQNALILVFEGDDAAGKGGTIRRIAHALDLRQYHIMPVSAPTDEERARPYLWRFWRNLPALGRIGIFDRSWYGRVLVERVEGLVNPTDWQRAYTEINDFEAALSAHGALILKFWLAITPDEQLKRFRAREQSPFKSFKLTPDDWRNRSLNAQYRQAATEMFAATHTAAAPWHVVAANDKRLARVAVLRTIVSTLEAR